MKSAGSEDIGFSAGGYALRRNGVSPASAPHAAAHSLSNPSGRFPREVTASGRSAPQPPVPKWSKAAALSYCKLAAALACAILLAAALINARAITEVALRSSSFGVKPAALLFVPRVPGAAQPVVTYKSNKD